MDRRRFKRPWQEFVTARLWKVGKCGRQSRHTFTKRIRDSLCHGLRQTDDQVFRESMKHSGQEKRQFRLFYPAVLMLVSAAALLRLALSLYFPHVLWGDEPGYLLLGHNLVTGNGFTYTGYPEVHFPPLHPLSSVSCL